MLRPFHTALRTVKRLSSVVVRVQSTTGETGYGEAPPTAAITGETKDSILSAIHSFIRPALLDMDLSNLEDVFSRLSSCVPKNHSAKAAVDIALYDLYGKHLGKPLYALLGGNRRELETSLTISLDTPDQMAEDSLNAIRKGCRILKLKLGRGGNMDIRRVSAVREAVGPQIRLWVDANQGWTPWEAILTVSAMEQMGLHVELVEQPVDARNLMGMQMVTRQVNTPVLADESVFSLLDAQKVLERNAADAINIKLMKTGGIHSALTLCETAAAHGAPCMMGCMLESKIAVSAAAHLAAAKSVFAWTDLDGPLLCRTDPFEGGAIFSPGKILLTDAPGLGITKTPCSRWSGS